MTKSSTLKKDAGRDDNPLAWEADGLNLGVIRKTSLYNQAT